jgi:hypothetical protein
MQPGAQPPHQALSGPGCGMGKRRSSTTPHSPPESRAGGKSKRVPVPGQSRSWLPIQAPQTPPCFSVHFRQASLHTVSKQFTSHSKSLQRTTLIGPIEPPISALL